MLTKKRFDDLLNECLDRILQGETVEQCLRKYPEQAQQLEPLLRAALAMKTSKTINPRPEFKAQARLEFQSALQEMATRKKPKLSFSWHPQWRWQSGWAIAVMAIVVVILGCGGTVAMASNSMPDSALYPVKLATEQIQLAITPSDTSKAELNDQFADRRAEEISYLASKGDTPRIQAVTENLNTHLDKITSLTENGNGARVNENIKPGKSVPRSPSNTGLPGRNNPLPGMAAAPAASVNPLNRPLEQPLNGQQPQNNPTLSVERQKLTQSITDHYQARQARLEEALKKASPKAKESILQTIAQSHDAYEKQLNNLESDNNAN